MIIVVKLGGSTLENLHSTFFYYCKQLQTQGHQLIVVHGGGPEISKYMEKMNKSSQFVQGKRITDSETLSIAEMVLAGRINKWLVRKWHQSGLLAIGLSGIDLALIQVRPQDPEMGFVGEVLKVSDRVLKTLLRQGWVPVIASLGIDQEGQHYNVNADEVASNIAITMQADRLIFVSDVDGISVDGQVLSEVTANQISFFIQNQQISGGMVPKVQAGLHALSGGVKEVMVVNGQIDWLAEKEIGGTRFIQSKQSIQ